MQICPVIIQYFLVRPKIFQMVLCGYYVNEEGIDVTTVRNYGCSDDNDACGDVVATNRTHVEY